MLQLEESVVVSRPRREVFSFAARPENVPLWNRAVVTSMAEGPLAQGTRVCQETEVLGRRFRTFYEVSCYEPGRMITFSSTSGPMRIEGTMTFESVPGGTRVRWKVRGDQSGFLRIADALLVSAGRRELRRCLAELKALVEEAAPARAAAAKPTESVPV